ncbi:MAG: amino acid transporter [Pseudomonadota bacterium]
MADRKRPKIAMTDDEKLVHNERVKLYATFLNGLGIALFAVGGLAPLFSSVYGPQGVQPATLIISLLCILVAFALHYGARRHLRRLRF